MEAGLRERFKTAPDFQGAFGPNVDTNEGGLLRAGHLATRPQLDAAYNKLQQENSRDDLFKKQLLSYVKEMAYSSTWGKKYGEAF